MAKEKDISIEDAAQRVGRAIFGDDWIGAITTRERWLIERYVEGRPDPSPSSILAGRTTWIMGGRPWAEYPRDPALVAETERARDRDDWCKAQWDQAFSWLEDHGFDGDAVTIEADALARKMACAFPPNSPAPKRKGGRPTAVDWGVVKNEMLRLMDYHGELGSDSPKWNVQARLEEALRKFCCSKFGKRPANSTIQAHLKPWLAE
jgi:hypothetical protein